MPTLATKFETSMHLVKVQSTPWCMVGTLQGVSDTQLQCNLYNSIPYVCIRYITNKIIYNLIYIYISLSLSLSLIPVVPHRTRRWRKFHWGMHGWQSEPTDGPKGGWSVFLRVVAMVAVVTSPTTAGCSVVQCSACVVVVAVVVCCN